MAASVVAAVLCLPAPAATPAEVCVEYTDRLAAAYARLESRPCTLPAGLALAPERPSASRLDVWHAVLRQTDPVAVPYDEARACIAFTGPGGARLDVSLWGFRTVGLEWLNDRLVLITTDIGHAAGVTQVLDLEAKRWIYQLGESYTACGDASVEEGPRPD